MKRLVESFITKEASIVEYRYNCWTSSIRLSNSLLFINMNKFINADCVTMLLATEINVKY